MNNAAPPDHDPWLKVMEIWTIRILKFGCLVCVTIFVIKIVVAELGFKPWLKSSNDASAATVSEPK